MSVDRNLELGEGRLIHLPLPSGNCTLNPHATPQYSLLATCAKQVRPRHPLSTIEDASPSGSMEVHTNGWPEHLPENAVKKQLGPIMAKLRIPADTFACNKPKQAKWANLTFLHTAHGQAFLNRHGEELLVNTFAGRGRPRRNARLQVMGCQIFCCVSKERGGNNAPPKQPDPITLRGLRHAVEEKANPTHRVEHEEGPEVFGVDSFSCGHTAFLDGHLVYLPEVEFQDVGSAKLTKRTLLIKLESKRVIKIPLDTVVSFVHSFQHTLTLTLSEQPSFFQDLEGLAQPHFQEVDVLRKIFGRLGINGGIQAAPTRTRLCSLDDHHARVVGQCLVYQLQVSGNDIQRWITSLKKHDMLPYVRYSLITQRSPPLQLGTSRQAMDALKRQLSAYTQGSHLPFGILFQLQSLAYNAYFHPGTVLALARELRKVAQERPISIEAIKRLKETPWPLPHGDASLFDVRVIMKFLKKTEDKFANGEMSLKELVKPSHNLALIHRVMVTPTRITLHGPELEAKNRILRKFPNHHEYFIRVQFCDESGGDLFFNPKISNEEVYKRFRGIFQDGIQIAGRTYSFLGWSHSSLRSHSVWVC